MILAPIVTSLHIAPTGGAAMQSHEQVRAIANRGLEGDRYSLNTGYYSNKDGWGAQVTLIQSEAIEAVNRGYHIDFTGAMLRRNIVTQGIKLEDLIGRNFACGEAILFGVKPYPPCAHLAYLLGRPEVLKYFAYCGGIGASVIQAGLVKLGDELRVLPSSDKNPPTSP